MTDKTEIDLATIFLELLEGRRRKNPNYSMRAFARDMGISSGRMSDLINKKYIPGQSVASRILNSLDLEEEEKRQLQRIIELNQLAKKQYDEARLIKEHEYSIACDWYHFAILNLMRTDNYKDDPVWIADRLGLNLDTVNDSLSALMGLGYIELKEGRRTPTYKNIATTNDIPSDLIKEGHRQVIRQSLDSLDDHPAHLRDITSIVVAANMANLPKAKELCRTFRRKLANLLEEGEKTEVYNICVQVVPVTKINQ